MFHIMCLIDSFDSIHQRVQRNEIGSESELGRVPRDTDTANRNGTDTQYRKQKAFLCVMEDGKTSADGNRLFELV